MAKKEAAKASGPVVGPRDGLITVSIQMPGKDPAVRHIHIANIAGALLHQQLEAGSITGMMTSGLVAKCGQKVKVLT